MYSSVFHMAAVFTHSHKKGGKELNFLGRNNFKRSITEKECQKGTDNDGIVCASVNKEMRATFAR